MKTNLSVIEYFALLKKHEQLRSSYLIVGYSRQPVREIVKLLTCEQGEAACNSCWDCRHIDEGTHPDVRVVEPEFLTTTIEAVRDGMRFLTLKSMRLCRKVLIIENVAGLTPEAASAFLKTLEEPPKHSLIILGTARLEGLLDTVVSRCSKIFMPPVAKEHDTNMYRHVAGFLEGKDLAFADRKQFVAFLETLQACIRAGLVSRLGLSNNQLPQAGECEIILARAGTQALIDTLEGVLKVSAVQNSINMNLALGLIRLTLGN